MESRAQKRSLSGRSLSFILHFQSVVPSSVSVHHYTRSLPPFGAFPFKKKFLILRPSVAFFKRFFFNYTPSFLAGANVTKIKNPIIDFAPFGCTFFLVVFAVSRSKLLQAVVPLCFPAPLVFVPTATPPPVLYSVSLRLHYGRSLGGYVGNGS